MPSRRSFLTGAASAAALMPASPAPPPETKPSAPSDALKLGVASYSLREFSRKLAIKMTKSLSTPYINVKEFHMPYRSTPDELAKARKDFAGAGLIITGGGTVDMKKDTDEAVRASFDYAKAGGIPMMVIAPTAQTLPRIERFVKEYDIRVAIHNHGPEDKHFPAPEDALKLIRNMDPRVGLCIDIGHTTRTGTDVIRSIRDAGPRLFDLHVKDLRNLMDKDSQCVVGEGAMPIAAIFRELLKSKFSGTVMLEYEIDADNPLPGMQRSFSYMRGVLAGLNGA